MAHWLLGCMCICTVYVTIYNIYSIHTYICIYTLTRCIPNHMAGNDALCLRCQEGLRHQRRFQRHWIAGAYYFVEMRPLLAHVMWLPECRSCPLPHQDRLQWHWTLRAGVVNPQCWMTLTPENVQDIHLQGIGGPSTCVCFCYSLGSHWQPCHLFVCRGYRPVR